MYFAWAPTLVMALQRGAMFECQALKHNAVQEERNAFACWYLFTQPLCLVSAAEYAEAVLMRVK